jgi:hypothetical protein
MRTAWPLAMVLLLAGPAAAQGLVERAKALELDTPYVPPPGDPLEHHAAGFAKVMCSAVFITGLDPEFAAQNVGFFTAPYGERARLGKPVVDRAARAVHVTLPNGVKRTARFLGDQGCVTLPVGKDSAAFGRSRSAEGCPIPRLSRGPWATAVPRSRPRRGSTRPRSSRRWTRRSSRPPA